jgi:hypothetical protein
LVADQVNVALPPLATLLGFELIVTVGGVALTGVALTVTVADWVALPPVPVHVNT